MDESYFYPIPCGDEPFFYPVPSRELWDSIQDLFDYNPNDFDEEFEL